MASVELQNLSKRFGAELALEGLSLSLDDGEFVVVLGPSGCGKTTLLRLIAGLETPTAGRVMLDGRDVSGVPPRLRNVAMVFQHDALYPHLTIADNLGFGLRVRGAADSEIGRRVGAAAESVGLTSKLGCHPAELSGGERQRAALARAMVREPAVFLLDEPLSHLDAPLRDALRGELAGLHQRLGATMIYVTHDQTEAMSLGDRVVVLSGGRCEQIGRPLEIYDRPATQFVAGFVGSPAMNFLTATWDGRQLQIPDCQPFSPDSHPALASGAAAPCRVVLGIRPEALRLCDGSAAGAASGRLHGRIAGAACFGFDTVVRLEWCGRELLVRQPGRHSAAWGSDAEVWFEARSLHWFDPDSGRRLNAGPVTTDR